MGVTSDQSGGLRWRIWDSSFHPPLFDCDVQACGAESAHEQMSFKLPYFGTSFDWGSVLSLHAEKPLPDEQESGGNGANLQPVR
jgi:hypothetical protein